MSELKKKILLVSNGFYPEISPRSFRATELAKELICRGYDVTVFSKFRDHDYTDFLQKYPLKFKMWEKSTFRTVPDFKNSIGSIFSRIANRLMLLLFEYPAVEEVFKVRSILNAETGYDLLISFSAPYPVHWGVALSRTKKHKIAHTWVADCGDPYMGDVLDTFRKPFYFKYIEKWFMRKADFVTIPIENGRKAYYPEFHEKIHIIPQGFSFEGYVENNEEIINPIITFGYAGSLAPFIRDPRPLLDYISTLELDFRFVVFTNQKDLFQQHLSKLGSKLVLRNYIPRDELLLELSKMDFLVNFDNNTEIQSPSKLIDYYMTNRPVLNIEKQIYPEIIDEFLQRNYSRKMKFDNIQKYNIKNIVNSFLQLKQ
ncbi:MAG: glycosyltransferase [Bacteroidales bacterium]|nr:glycosyltransferase [Bacteroidales bacterium]